MCENLQDQLRFNTDKENFVFIADMHDYHILSNAVNGNEVQYDTAEKAAAYAQYLNNLDIEGLRTKAISYPHRIYLKTWQD